MDISYIVNKIKELTHDMPVKAILPDNTVVDMSTQQYVVDGEYYMFAQADGFDEAYQHQHTTEMFKHNLEYEASDSCWRTQYDIFGDGKSDFLDCEVYVVTGNYDDYYNYLDTDTYAIHETFGAKIEDDIFYIICTKPEASDNDDESFEIPKSEHITLTDAEKAIVEKLNCGCYTVEYLEHWINRNDLVEINAPAALVSMSAKGFYGAIKAMARLEENTGESHNG